MLVLLKLLPKKPLFLLIVLLSALFVMSDKLCLLVEAQSFDLGSPEYDQLINTNEAVKLAAEARRLEFEYASLWNDNRFEEAILKLKQALTIWQKLGHKRKEGYILNLLAVSYGSFGQIEQSLQLYKQALAIYQEVDDPEQKSDTLLSLGSLSEKDKNYQQALDYYQEALTIGRQINNRCIEVTSLHNIGGVYLSIAHPYNQDQIPNKDTLTNGKSLNEIRQQALDYFYQALPLAHISSCYLTSVLNSIAVTYEHLGQQQEALKFYQQALAKESNESAKATLLSNIALVKSKEGNLEEALTDIKAAIEIVEKFRNNLISQEFRTGYFSSQQHIYKVYIDILMQLHQQNPSKDYNAQALYASERARARSLLELLTEAKANIRQGVDSKLLEEEESLQKQLNNLDHQKYKLTSSQYSQRELNEIQQKIDSVIAQLNQLKAQIRIASPRYADLKYPEPLNLQQIQNQVLDDDTLLLEYSLGTDRSYLWAVSKNSITSYILPKQSEIEVAVQTFRKFVTENSGANLESGLPLSQMLLAPVANQLANKRLLIVGDGVLQYIPFAALPIPGNQKIDTNKSNSYQPLLVQNEIITLPSASTVAIQRRQLKNRPFAAKTLAVIADPIFNLNDDRFSGNPPAQNSDTITNYTVNNDTRNLGLGDAGKIFDRLTFTRTEAEKIISFVPETQRFQAFDFNASRQIATNPDLSQYQIIHFATHGLVDPINPELSGVVLSLYDEKGKSQDGFLRLHDIFNLNLPAELVVLSACETGLGKEVKGEGLVGLTRGFMYAGAKRVVVSLWSVNDVATSELMAKFYQNMLQDKENPIKALREAQLEMWNAGKSPYYWAAFTVQGDWR